MNTRRNKFYQCHGCKKFNTERHFKCCECQNDYCDSCLVECIIDNDFMKITTHVCKNCVKTVITDNIFISLKSAKMFI